jgi:hypothetical protein
MKFFLLLSLLFFVCFFSALSQNIQTDTAFVSAAIKNTKEIYTEAIKNQSTLYNGSEYIDYVPLRDEHPYYISQDWIVGDVFYDDMLHKNVPLLYNIQTDHVIIEQNLSGIMIQLIKEKVGYFIIKGHKFVNLLSRDLPIGFYEQLNTGNAMVYVKHTKAFLEEFNDLQIKHSFEQKARYFICKENQCLIVRNKGALLSVLTDQKRGLNQFIRKSHFDFRKDMENSIVKSVDFYNANLIKK